MAEIAAIPLDGLERDRCVRSPYPVHGCPVERIGIPKTGHQAERTAIPRNVAVQIDRCAMIDGFACGQRHAVPYHAAIRLRHQARALPDRKPWPGRCRERRDRRARPACDTAPVVRASAKPCPFQFAIAAHSPQIRHTLGGAALSGNRGPHCSHVHSGMTGLLRFEAARVRQEKPSDPDMLRDVLILRPGWTADRFPSTPRGRPVLTISGCPNRERWN
jgi:hypothetical protein